MRPLTPLTASPLPHTHTHSAFNDAVASHVAESRGEALPPPLTAAATRAAATGVALGGNRSGYVHHSAAVKEAVAGVGVGGSVQAPAVEDDGGSRRHETSTSAAPALPPQPPPPPVAPAWLYAEADAFR